MSFVAIVDIRITMKIRNENTDYQKAEDVLQAYL